VIESAALPLLSVLGDGQPYHRMPNCFTDQHDLGMEYVGHVDTHWDAIEPVQRLVGQPAPLQLRDHHTQSATL
jgi:hypothetical protein